MNTLERSQLKTLKSFYLLTFFGIGSMYPLLSVYLRDVQKMNGYEIGLILSIGPIIMIFFQPLWGMLSDNVKKPTKLLMITTILAGLLSLGFTMFEDFYGLFLIALMVSVFQSAIIPISDSISLKFSTRIKENYGNIRLFGSLGFGLAVFIMGKLSEHFAISIFISFCVSLVLASLLTTKIPNEKIDAKMKIFTGIKELFAIKKFTIFLVVTFMIFGPNLANNFYFSLFIQDRGGTYTGIGIAFLVAVLSEIPFMRVAGNWINKIGILQVATLAGVISCLRWLLYFSEPNLNIIYITSVIQGFSIGLFIPAALQYIREITPVQITATAVTIYSAIGNGLGNWFSTFISGIIYEELNIYFVYLFFFVMGLIGVLLTMWLVRKEKGHSYKRANLAEGR
ncbi:MFS transporter [Neobacillus sp. D3-1R]|uniref:MFS transporter n=1 Tax=Neobacillus sp. D3-1R TaxID=3445778 RepID=UPI003F9F02EE